MKKIFPFITFVSIFVSLSTFTVFANADSKWKKMILARFNEWIQTPETLGEFIGDGQMPRFMRIAEKLLGFHNKLFNPGHHFDSENGLSYPKQIKKDLLNSKLPEKKSQLSYERINDWLFNGKQDSAFPSSKLKGRNQAFHLPKKKFEDVLMVGTGEYNSRIGIHSGGITDLEVQGNHTAAVGDSNNGDLLTGCGYAVAKAVVNAAGAGLQQELYNRFGVPNVLDTPQYAKENYSHTEGRGYAITCQSYDMKMTHGIDTVELLVVPMHSEIGVKNMYKEAFLHSKEKDYLALPMAGMTHPVLKGRPKLNAKLALDAFKEFVDENPGSHLKVIFTIWEDPQAEQDYRDQANSLSVSPSESK